MGTFATIPSSTFDDLQLDAGVVLTSFNPASPTVTDSAIVCATTGGISISVTPNYSDFGEDVDNCPNNTKELKHLDDWTVTLGFTGIGTTPAMIKRALGAADIDGTDSTKVTPRGKVVDADFETLWWVGDKADGGLVAVKFSNALSTSGFSLQTTKNGKGQLSCEFTAHVSIDDPTAPPVEFYATSA